MYDHVLAVRKTDGAKLRLPRHLVEMQDDLDLAPTQREIDKARAVRVTEPATTTVTTRASRATSKES